MRKTIKSLLGIIVSVVFIWLTFHDTDLQLMVSHLRRLPVKPIVLCLVGQLAFQILHWIRWGLVLRQLGRVSWIRIFIVGAVGNAALYIFPVRSGELVRPALASGENEIDFGQATATSVLERIVDGLLISAILFGSLIVMRDGMAPRVVYNSGMTFAVIFLGCSLFLIIGYRYKDAIVRVLQQTVGCLSSHWVNRLISLYKSFIQGIHQLSAGNVLIPYLGLSIILWGMDIISIYWLFGILSNNLPFIAAPVVIAILALGSLIPSGPAQLGVFEFSIVFSLGFFSIKSEEAVLFGTLFHIVVICLVSVLGILGLWLGRQWLKHSARNMRKSSLK